jgi:hypothetical protein
MARKSKSKTKISIKEGGVLHALYLQYITIKYIKYSV